MICKLPNTVHRVQLPRMTSLRAYSILAVTRGHTWSSTLSPFSNFLVWVLDPTNNH